jgi:hypothetical protein
MGKPLLRKRCTPKKSLLFFSSPPGVLLWISVTAPFYLHFAEVQGFSLGLFIVTGLCVSLRACFCWYHIPRIQWSTGCCLLFIA